MFDGTVIRKAREAKGLSQEKLGALIGRSTTYIGGIEMGMKCEAINAMKRLCDVLGLRVQDVFTDDSWD